jgi:hypothetical protein
LGLEPEAIGRDAPTYSIKKAYGRSATWNPFGGEDLFLLVAMVVVWRGGRSALMKNMGCDGS